MLPPLSLYIHIPWCEKKCPYCDFNSHVQSTALPEHDYIACLEQDLISQLSAVQNRNLHSIFIGGGTPSLFSAAAIKTILENVKKHIPFADDIEITLEANPGSAEAEKFSDLLAAGINRLSIGVQSFDDHCLKSLGRIHNKANAIAAINMAQDAGFMRINIDLMHGLPQQTLAMAKSDLQQAVDLGVEHISWYQLTIEQNTQFYRYPPRLPCDDALADIQDLGFSLLANNGFEQYEISAFCKDKQQARHNVNYWRYGDYLAIGAGAHGKISRIKDGLIQVERFNNSRNPQNYLQRQQKFIAANNVISSDDALFEALMNGLRLTQGMNKAACLAYSGSSEQQLFKIAQPAINKGLLEINERIMATALGRQYLNTLLESLLPQ